MGRYLYNYTSPWLEYTLNMHTQCDIPLTRMTDIIWKKYNGKLPRLYLGLEISMKKD